MATYALVMYSGNLCTGHVQCRWPTPIPTVDKIVKGWEVIKTYFLQEFLKLGTQEEKTYNERPVQALL